MQKMTVHQFIEKCLKYHWGFSYKNVETTDGHTIQQIHIVVDDKMHIIDRDDEVGFACLWARMNEIYQDY